MQTYKIGIQIIFSIHINSNYFSPNSVCRNVFHALVPSANVPGELISTARYVPAHLRARSEFCRGGGRFGLIADRDDDMPASAR